MTMMRYIIYFIGTLHTYIARRYVRKRPHFKNMYNSIFIIHRSYFLNRGITSTRIMIRARCCFNLRKLPSFGFTTTCNTAFVDHELSRIDQNNCIMYRPCRSLASLKFQHNSFSTSAAMGKHGQLDSDIKMNTKMQHDDVDVSIQVHGNDAIEEGYLVSKYRSKADKSNVLLDEHQITALTELDRLRSEVLSSPFYKNETPSSNSTFIGDGEEEGYSSIFSFSSSIATAKQSTFSFLKNIQMGGDSDSQEREMEQEQGRGPIIKGVYLHGGVGCGKTFCMDLFFENLPIASKQKVHFHKFMLDVHRKMHEAKMVKRVKGDVMPSVIDSILENGLIICFDEFQVRVRLVVQVIVCSVQCTMYVYVCLLINHVFCNSRPHYIIDMPTIGNDVKWIGNRCSRCPDS